MFEIYETSNPYFVSCEKDKETEEIIITMGIDQLFINPDTNEEKIITEYYNAGIADAMAAQWG